MDSRLTAVSLPPIHRQYTDKAVRWRGDIPTCRMIAIVFSNRQQRRKCHTSVVTEKVWSHAMLWCPVRQCSYHANYIVQEWNTTTNKETEITEKHISPAGLSDITVHSHPVRPVHTVDTAAVYNLEHHQPISIQSNSKDEQWSERLA